MPDINPGSYCVFLHQGCSLEKHKLAVGEEADIESKIRHIFPETRNHGLYYCADNVDDVTLDAVRADIIVDMIECDRSPEISFESEIVEIFERPDL